MSTSVNGKYMLERRLGGGGMAEVFLARTVGAEGFSRTIAIKRVLAGYSENPQFAKMFVEEAQLCARLQHPNIVSVLDFDRDHEGRLFLAMELVDGIDLDMLANSGLLPFDALIYIVIETLRGLGYAHELPVTADGIRGIVHRDVSPHNVLLSWEGAVKVSDFGIAKARAASNATATAMIKGKPAYMSPEQANGEPLDGRSDLFAVGIMLWELLCGRPLFAGATTQETLARLLFAPIPSPRELRPEIPQDLAHVVERLLARERTARYPNAGAAITDLVNCAMHPRNGREVLMEVLAQRFIERAPVRARSGVAAAPTMPTYVIGAGPRSYVASQAPLPRPSDGGFTAPARPRSPGRRAWWIAAALVVIVGGVVAVAAVATTRSNGPVAPRGEQGATRPPSPDAALPVDGAVAPVDSAPIADAPGPDAPSELLPDAAGVPLVAPDATPAPHQRPHPHPGKDPGIHEVHLGGG